MRHIILHWDGTLSFSLRKPEKESVGREDRVFEVCSIVTIDQIIEWQRNDYTHKLFKEIELGGGQRWED